MSKLLFFIITLGALMRIIGSFTIPITFDEAFNILLPKTLNIALIVKGTAEVHPPLYFLLSHFWGLISDNFQFIRLLSVILGTATIPAIAFVGKKLFNEKVGLLAAFFFAISTSQIYYDSIGRMYALAVFESVWAIYFFIKFIREKSSLLPFGLILILGLYTHYFFTIFLLTLNIYIIYHWRKLKSHIRPWIIANIILFLLFIPAIFIILSAKPTISVPASTIIKLPIFYIIPQLPWDIIQTLKLFQYHQIDFPSTIAVLIAVLTTIILIASIFFINHENNLKILLLIYFLAPPIILIISHTLTKIAALRSFILFSPLFFLIIASTILNFRKWWRLGIILLLTILLSISYIQTCFYSPNFSKQIAGYFSDNDIIVYNDVTVFLPTILHKPQGKHLLLFPNHLPNNSYKAINVHITKYNEIPFKNHLWYIKLETDWPPYEEQANSLKKNLEKRYNETSIKSFYKLKVIKYRKKT